MDGSQAWAATDKKPYPPLRAWQCFPLEELKSLDKRPQSRKVVPKSLMTHGHSLKGIRDHQLSVQICSELPKGSLLNSLKLSN